MKYFIINFVFAIYFQLNIITINKIIKSLKKIIKQFLLEYFFRINKRNTMS
jgi:hypothetical protein